MKWLKFFLVFMLIFTSCNSTKKAMSNPYGMEVLSAKKVAKKHIAKNFAKETVDAKLKVHFKNEKENIGFSVKMKIKKDEVIWLKGSKVITVFKAKITPTKVSFYSSYYKNYFEGDFSMIKELLGTEINFYQLQNLLLGQTLQDVSKKKQRVAIVDRAYQLSPKKQADLFKIFFQIEPTHFKVKKQYLVNENNNQRLDISYPNYTEKDGEIFPQKIVINAIEKGSATNVDITVRSVKFNTPLQMPFKIPVGYKEIKI